MNAIALSAAGLLVLAPAARSPRTDLSHAPAPGTAWRTEVSYQSRLTFREMTVRMGGQPVPSQFLPTFEMELGEDAELVVVDRILASDQDRSGRIEREFADGPSAARSFFMEMSTDPDAATDELAEGRSPLEGRRVLLERQDGERAWTPRWPDGEEGPGEWLPAAGLDLALEALLPEEAVEEDDSWTVEADALLPLLHFHSHLGALLEGADGGREESELLERTGPEGELELRLVSLDREAGRARIALEGRLEGREQRAISLDDIPVTGGPGTEDSTEVQELRGELLWDLAAGVPLTLELEAEVVVTAVRSKDDPPTPGQAFESTTVLEGLATWKLTRSAE